ncbi:MAG TPA: lysylphosphatidylglycerol synthase transmembrane domain-containing protein [Gaiellaceae bacterium]|nr:lysylphosphatidylglycerol synthase transmembrane domain-containing protein [Gaiellaceae bacterium]
MDRTPEPTQRPRRSWRRLLVGLLAALFVLATFAYFLPKIADYRDVWDVLQGLSWQWAIALAGVTVLNLLTFAPPWLAALPGISFRRAFALTQMATALALVVPGGAAVGIAGSYGILRRWGFPRRAIGRALTLVSLWNQFANLSYPIIAIFLLTVEGGDSPLLATAAFVGAAVLGIAVAALAAVLASERAATDIGDLAARLLTWARAKVGRQPVTWGGPSFERFRAEAVDLLARRWHVLTLATYVGTLTVFLVLLVALRALGVPGSEVTVVEAFAAWSLARLLGTIPITPGGIGVVELSLTAALVGFGGNNAGVVAAVLVYRFLTIVPTIALGLAATSLLNRQARRATVSA